MREKISRRDAEDAEKADWEVRDSKRIKFSRQGAKLAKEELRGFARAANG